MNTVFILASLLIIKASKAHSVGSSFSKMPYLELAGDMIKTITVPNIFECCWKCDRIPECLSLNVANMPDKDGLYDCHMLRNSETNKYSGLLRPSQRYHHYARFTDQCRLSRCLNGARCDNTKSNDVRCHCPQGYMDDLCSIPYKTYKWLKINTSPVCFGAKGDSYGMFNIKENGTITTVKLVHVSGYVVCDTTRMQGQSNWGCAPFNYGSNSYPDRLMTIMTDDKNQKILPQDEFITNQHDFSYEIPGSSSKSPVLIFKNFTTPMDVTAGQEYRIWYGQDLNNISDRNNGGTSCADVYMYGVF